MNFLNIEKNIYKKNLQHFMFSSRFMLFPTFTKKRHFGAQENFGGPIFFFMICFFNIFTFYTISNIFFFLGNIVVSTYWFKWEVVSPNSRYRDSRNLYPIYPLFPCSDFFISNVGGGGG